MTPNAPFSDPRPPAPPGRSRGSGGFSRRRLFFPAVVAVAGLALVGPGSVAALATTSHSTSHSTARLFTPFKTSHAKAAAPAVRGAIAHKAKAARPVLGARPRLSVSATTVAPAFIYTVNTTADTPDVTPGDDICADGAVPANCSLRAAVMEADADTGLVRIMVPAASYTLAVAVASPDDASTGDLNLDNDTGGIEIVGSGSGIDGTIINASGVADRAFEVGTNSGATDPASISHLTIEAGNSSAGNNNDGVDPVTDGGGVLVNQTGALTLDDDSITGNTTGGASGAEGGGIYNNGSLWLASTLVAYNTGADGGGLYDDELAHITTTTFSHNTAGGYGGGVYTDYPTDISSTDMSNNAAGTDGGGIYADDAINLTTVNLTSNTAEDGAGAYFDYPVIWTGGTASHNTATSDGGGFYVDDVADVSAVDVTDNTAGGSGDGGGVYTNEDLAFTGGSIDGNYAEYGGGLYNDENATLTSTEVDTNQSNDDEGAGIYTDDSLSLSGVAVSHNSGADEGGGIYNDYLLSGVDVTLADNASTDEGGGLYNDEEATLASSTLSGNYAATAGGGVYNDDYLALKADVVTGNNAVEAGGGVLNDDDLTWNLGTLSDNTTTAGEPSEGGGLYNDDDATLNQLTIAGNSAGAGGGLANDDDGTLQVDGSTFVANAANFGPGGGLANEGETQLTNDTLTQNTTVFEGGAIATADDGDNPFGLEATEVTINLNTAAEFGGGIFADNSDQTVFRSSIVTANTANGVDSGPVAGSPEPTGATDNCAFEGTVTATYTLDSGTFCGFDGTGDISGLWAQLAGLGNYGGPTETERLTTHSPAIDSAGTDCATATDARGTPRPQLAGCDMGAVEVTQLSMLGAG